MRTAIEIDRDSKPLRVYHRTPTMAWTHPIGELRADAACLCVGERIEPHPESAASRKKAYDRERLRRLRESARKQGLSSASRATGAPRKASEQVS